MPVDPTATASAGLRATNAPDLPARDPFVFVHYSSDPTSWEACEDGLDGTYWLPVLRELPLRPGVVGTRSAQRGESIEDTIGTTRDTVRRRGGFWLDWPSQHDRRFLVKDAEHLPEGLEPGAYIRLTETRSGAKHYHSAWSEPRPALRGRQPTARFHQEPYNRWRHHLVASGVIQPPSEDLLADLTNQAERRVAMTRQDSRTDPADIRGPRMSKAEARLQRVQRAQVPAPPKPKRAKRAPATAEVSGD